MIKIIMGCCGNTIKKGKQIIEGYTNLAIRKRFEFTNERIKTCQRCEKNTWLTKKQYALWLIKVGIKSLWNLAQKEIAILPELVKEKYQAGRVLYCIR